MRRTLHLLISVMGYPLVLRDSNLELFPGLANIGSIAAFASILVNEASLARFRNLVFEPKETPHCKSIFVNDLESSSRAGLINQTFQVLAKLITKGA